MEYYTFTKKIFQNDELIGYRLVDKFNNAVDINPDELYKRMNSNKISVINLKTTPQGLITYINDDRFDKLELYESKQKLLGKVFDFYINKRKNEIYVIKYYDRPSRQVVVIPDFVDKIKEHDEFHLTGLFSSCAYIEKVIMNSNVHGDLDCLFKRFNGYNLDLTEFDTSNIDSMSEMFNFCNVKSLQLNGKFNTHNVFDMSHMFAYGLMEKLNLGNDFDTAKVVRMSSMFNFASIEDDLILGDKFYTTNNIDIEYMFNHIKVKGVINLGSKFKITDNLIDDSTFDMCDADKIIVGNTETEIVVKSLTNIPVERME